MNPFSRSFQVVTTWAVTSQQQARRNAMIASTRLAQRRAERIEVEEFLASRFAASPHNDADAHPPAPAAHA